jgi:hypothetical protein
MTRLAAVFAAIACSTAAGAGAYGQPPPCSWGSGPTPNTSYVHGVTCATARDLAERALAAGRAEGIGPWRVPGIIGWRFWKTDGGVVGNNQALWIDARVGCAPCAGKVLWTKKIGKECSGRGYVEGYTVYRMTCAKGWTLVRRIPTNGAETWSTPGFRWWAHPNYQVATIIALGAASYVIVLA